MLTQFFASSKTFGAAFKTEMKVSYKFANGKLVFEQVKKQKKYLDAVETFLHFFTYTQKPN